jgi:hypothetical protein
MVFVSYRLLAKEREMKKFQPIRNALSSSTAPGNPRQQETAVALALPNNS